jgi:hypothetical protein
MQKFSSRKIVLRINALGGGLVGALTVFFHMQNGKSISNV